MHTSSRRLVSPSTLRDSDAKHLYLFFNSEPKQKVWPKDLEFSIHDQAYVLGYTIVQRQRKPGKVGVRYEFISERFIGLGSYGTKVYPIAATMVLTKDSISFTKVADVNDFYHKTRVVKVQKLSEWITPFRVQHEYEMSLKASHLAIKPPTMTDTDCYTVMRQAKGIELFEMLSKDSLTVQRRLELSKALLSALKQQVTEKGLIHRDIKPENIIVHPHKKPISITIIDYDKAGLISNPFMECGATLVYAAPELFTTRLPRTEKIDVFSMGRVLSEIWGIRNNSFDEENPYQIIYNANNMAQELETLFTKIAPLSTQNKRMIATILEQMLEAEWEQRCSIDEAIAAFDKINIHDVTPEASRISEPESLSRYLMSSIQYGLSFFKLGSSQTEEQRVKQHKIIRL